MKSMAIIGAGMAGLSLARQLQDKFSIQVFEKSDMVGGRMASYTFDKYQFDIGAQFFIAHSPPFKTFLKPYIKQGVVARWDACFVEMEHDRITQKWDWDEEYPHYVATPTMTALTTAMSTDLSLRMNTSINEIKRMKNGWELFDINSQSMGTFDWVVTAVPAQQATGLLPSDFAYYSAISRRELIGCYSLMLGFKQPLSIPWDAALVKNADISWVCNNHSKPNRPEGYYSLLIHATNSWADKNMFMSDKEVIEYLIKETSSVLQFDVSLADYINLHRWQYANISRHEEYRSCIDKSLQLAAIGDWCIKGRVEAAYLSALNASEKILMK